jgi:hypothetical protein
MRAAFQRTRQYVFCAPRLPAPATGRLRSTGSVRYAAFGRSVQNSSKNDSYQIADGWRP